MSCDFALLKEDVSVLMAIICLAAVIVVALDVFVWRKAPVDRASCVLAEPRKASSIDAYIKGCKK